MLEGCNKNVERVLVIISYFITYTSPRGESLFTYFASLACAFHPVIKTNSLNIERVREFQLSVKVLSPMYQYFIFEKLKTLQRTYVYGLITIWPPAICTVFDGCYFLFYCLQKAVNCTNSSN